MKPVLAIVVPCYNEQEVLPLTIERLSQILDIMIEQGDISDKSFLYFVDDGSRDNTWAIIKESSQKNDKVKALKLASNVGHQNALFAGLEQVANKCDCAVTIDADLQDDENAIIQMVKYYNQGYQIVYGVRSSRKKDTFFKRFSAEQFYRLMNAMGVNTVFNHADFRLLGKIALQSFLQFRERNLFIRGLIPLLGYKSNEVYYERKERQAGESKYPLKKMLAFAWEGITSFSVKPLRIITLTGFIVFIFTIIMALYTFYIVLFTDKAIQGWASTTLPIYFLGGIQLLAIGVIGEYIGKIYQEVKDRPRYFIDEFLE